MASREELLQYMVPGSTVDDIVDSDSESSDDLYFAGGQGGSSQSQQQQQQQANAQGQATSLAKFQPAQHKNADASVLNRIRVDEFYEGHNNEVGSGGARMNQRVLNELREMTMSNRFATHNASKNVDRSERATTENVMDPRTRLILYKLVNTGMLKEINGCVSTGKEANVYYAVASDGSAAAVKVYKTSILVFKDRDQYVSGEFRFQRYCKSNPRKMVRTWAEKEARNLTRLQAGGVLAPAVKLLRQHVLVMEFLGEDGWPAPRLKEVRFPSAAALDQCYLDLCCTMRKMFARCKLIHGDLSEYNLLLYRGRVVVIDVSQSVESDHPRAMDFLRRDIANVNAFFRAQGAAGLFSVQDLYHFITAPAANKGWQRCHGPDNLDELMQHLRELREERAAQGTSEADTAQALIDEQVFLQIPVPRTLHEVPDGKAPNAEIAGFVDCMMGGGDVEKHHHHPAASGDGAPEVQAHSSNEDSDDEEAEESEEESEEGDGSHGDAGAPEKRAKEKRPLAVPARTLAEMTKEERKEHSKAVKQAKRERREEKKRNKEAKGKRGKKK